MTGSQDPPEPPRHRRLGQQRRKATIPLIIGACAVLGGLAVASVGTALAGPSPSPSASASPGPSASSTGNPTAQPSPPSDPGSQGGPFDPLTGGELDRARTIALDAATVAAATDVNGDAGPEVLDSELIDADDSAAGARRAAIYFYNYRDNVLTKRVVNLTTGKVEETFTAKQMQPPLSKKEVDKAFQILLASKMADSFKSKFRHATGKDFTSPDQVTIFGHTYVADPGESNGAAECGAHRCVQLLPQASNGQFIDITGLVVDLSVRTARQR